MKAILKFIDELDRLDSHPDPEVILLQSASIVHRVGDMMARAGFSSLYAKSLEFGAYAETHEAKSYLSECLAAFGLTEILPETLNAKEVAQLLGCSERTVWRWEGRGVIPAALRIGRMVRWYKAKIQEMKAIE